MIYIKYYVRILKKLLERTFIVQNEWEHKKGISKNTLLNNLYDSFDFIFLDIFKRFFGFFLVTIVYIFWSSIFSAVLGAYILDEGKPLFDTKVPTFVKSSKTFVPEGCICKKLWKPLFQRLSFKKNFVKPSFRRLD